MKKILLAVGVLAVIVVVIVLAFGNGKSSKTSDLKLVKVEKGEIIEKAMAIGTIQPYKEIQVKSKNFRHCEEAVRGNRRLGERRRVVA